MLRDFKGGIMMDTHSRIAFGGVAGCGSFGRPADAWKLLMKHEFDLVQVFRWVDNNLFVKTVDSLVNVEQIVARLEELGVKTNPEKVHPFKGEQKYIGFIWNATRKTVRLPGDKRFQQIQQMLSQRAVLLDARMGTPRDGSTPTKPCTRRPRAVARNTTLFQRNPDPTDMGWVGDASTSYGIGILIGQRWAQFQLKEGWNDGPKPKRAIAWLETVAVRLGLIALEELKIRPGKTLIVWTDNTTTESTVEKQRATQPDVNEEWKKIQAMLVNMELDITAKRVTSKENAADALSRGDRTKHNRQHQILISVPFDLD
ncbi:hypothetical protein PSTG_01213 [Puccinia striiformis f. sp. tritici PST-78]|uniref:Uncharacterized protein n=1 Tax=Puccinia striiformis f. sp. tritici PST-78 TaxID=1165861 RepID=A0A0L0W2T1_9BASI|nr:hypothetical protein PSTG_01213 [Puccinia striiformis f. sp. tritici PST-78]